MYGVPGRRIDPVQIRTWLGDADRRRPEVDPDRWRAFIADAQKFVLSGWLDRALNLEWLDFELFGCDPVRPFDNSDDGRTGLVLALAGRTVVGLNRDYGVIRNIADDDCKIHSRHLQYQARVKLMKPLLPVWELSPAALETI